MKNLVLALTLASLTLPVFAQRHPGPGRGRGPGRGEHRPMPRPMPGPGRHRPMPYPMPIPRPMPTRFCSVVMLNQQGRVLQRYSAYTDFRTGMCRDGLRQCNFDLSRNGRWGARCVQTRY